MYNNSLSSNTYESLYESVLSTKVKILKVGIPIIKTWQNLAFPLSIICTDNKSKDWFYSNFIHIYALESSMSNDLDISFNVQLYEDNIYNLYKETMMIETMKNFNSDIINIIINCINNNKYIITFIDEYYVPFSLAFQEWHFNHDFFIIGYKLPEKKLITMGYGNDSQYRIREVSFDNFNHAWSSEHLNVSQPFQLYQWHDDNYMLPYKFDISFIKDSIAIYLSGEDPLHYNKHIYNNDIKKVYGVFVYQKINEYISNNYENNLSFDIKVFYLLYEHKKCMFRRIMYLKERCFLYDCDELLNGFLDIEKETEIIINLVIKYNLTKNMNIVNRIKTKLQIIEYNEKRYLNLLLNKI